MRDEIELEEMLAETQEVIDKGKNPNQEFAKGQKNALYWVLEKGSE